jgi:hypothetical protein
MLAFPYKEMQAVSREHLAELMFYAWPLEDWADVNA